MATPIHAEDHPAFLRLTVDVQGEDTQRSLSFIGLGGLAAAAFLAVIGGLPFDVPMPTQSFGWVEPTCGLTRGSTAIARGDFALAWRYNPLSFVVMGFGLYTVIRLVTGLVTHRWITVKARLERWGWIVFAVAFVAFWAYQQQHASFIIHSRL